MVHWRKGVTLIEAVLTLLILVILAGIVLPRMFGSGDFFIDLRARATANQVAVDLRLARRLAITHVQNYTVAFDTVNLSYDMTDAGGNSVIDFPKALSDEFTYGGDNTVEFDSLGSAVQGREFLVGLPPLPGGTVVLLALWL